MSMVNTVSINGVPVHRFRLAAKGPEGITEERSFSASWERSTKLYSLQRQGFDVSATDWNKDTNAWDDTTQAALNEGFNRAERSKKSSSAVKPEKPAKPVMAPEAADAVKAHSDLTKLVASSGRRSGLTEDTVKAVGMSAMQLLTNVGYSSAEIKALVKAYIASIEAQAEPVGSNN